jgi:ABC-type multidrug transport system permease subunit
MLRELFVFQCGVVRGTDLSQLNIIGPTILKEWKSQSVSTSLFYKFINDGTRGVALAWIVYQSGNFGALAYLCIGVALIAMWSGSVANSGWSLADEIYSRTMEFTLISRTSIPVILFSKILAQIAFEIPSGIVSIACVLAVARQIPAIASPGLLIPSLVLTVGGLAVLSLFLAALVVLVGGRAGFFMGIVPFGAVLSGFILPVDQLPYGLEALARLMPTSWAMDSVWLSIREGGSFWTVLQGWGMAVLLIAVWFTFTYYLCGVVEKRIRIKGTLGAT